MSKASPKFTLTINKREIDFNVGLGFLGEYQENHGDIQDTLEKIETNPFYYVPKLMYASALYENRGDLDFDERDLIEMIDSDGSIHNKGYVKFIQLFIEFLNKDVPKEDIDVKEAKKK